MSDLAKTYRIKRSPSAATWKRRFGLPFPTWQRHEVRAVDGVSFGISSGDVLGLVGESGSGKSTLARLVLRLIEPSRGRILFNDVDVTDLRPQAMQSFRSQAQIVFQNPDSSLNPRRTIGEAIARAVKLHAKIPPIRCREHVDALIDQVGLRRGYYDRYPHQLSGGEKQRVGIARALATNPTLLVCDEPVSSLDVSVQATVLNLLADLRDEYGLSYLFISHDLSIVAHLADRIAVMYAGWLAEIGPTDSVLNPPQHPYTEALLSAVPLADPAVPQRPRIMLRSDTVPSTGAAMGCPFQARCPRKLGTLCETETPPIRVAQPGHALACHIPLAELRKVQPLLRTR